MSDSRNFVIQDGYLREYHGPGGEVTVPEGVLYIGGAFRGCSSLTRLTIPNGVQVIEPYAFEGCTNLQQIELPDSLERIGESAFRGCARLTSIKIPSKCQFRDNVFSFCPALREIQVAEDSTFFTVQDEALYNKEQTQLIAWPCAEGTVELLPTVKKVAHYAFAGCTGLTGVVFPKDFEKLARFGNRRVAGNVFAGCVNLTEFRFLSDVSQLYGRDGALYQQDPKDGLILVSWPGAKGEVTIPDGVVKIGDGAFYGCSTLTQITIPSSVTKIGFYAFHDCTGLSEVVFQSGARSVDFGDFQNCTNLIRIVLPETIKKIEDLRLDHNNPCSFTVESPFLKTKERCSDMLISLVLFSNGEDLAYVILYQPTKAWQEVAQERISKHPELSENTVLTMTRLLAEDKRPKKISWEKAVAFVLKWQKNVKDETLQAFYALATEKKCPVLADLKSDIWLQERLGLKRKRRTKATEQSPKNPLELRILEQWTATSTVKELKKLIKSGVLYANSEEMCSSEALIWLISYPVDFQARLGDSTDATDHQILEDYRGNLDPLVAELNYDSLMDFLDTMVFSGKNAKLFIPFYCRYADEEQMQKLIKQSKEWHQWDRYGKRGRDLEKCVQDNLYYSDTKAAIRACERLSGWRAGIPRYAKMRGTTEEIIRDTVLADLGLDREGKKCYDLGGKTVEARMEEDLTLTLYDPEAGKAVKSLPKKGADPEKYEAAKKDFARLKKDIRAAVEERTNLLFQRFLDGEEQKGEDWKKVYFQNPMLNQIARLLVWSQGEHTFTMTLQGTVDAAGQPCEVGDDPVKVAHPMEMKREDLKRWQKYFTSHNLKQPFAQVWEPLVDFSTIRDYQYEELTLPANQLRNQEKHGIYFNYDYQTCVLKTHFADLNLACGFTEAQDHFLSKDAILVFGTLKVKKKSRAANHVLARLDKWMLEGRVRRDDATIVEALDNLTVAQVTELLNQAIKYHCTNCTAALLEYKNNKFPDIDPMDVFVLEGIE